MFAGKPHSIAEVVVAQVKFEPVIAAQKDEMPEDYFIANKPRRDHGRKKHGR